MSQAALFLDRDGVVNVDYGYVHRIEQVTFLPGIFDLARFVVQDLKWKIVITTNQAGIGRGYFDETQFETLMRWMCGRFSAEGAPVTKVYHCPYHPEHGVGPYRIDHPWRKPRPGMFLQAAQDLGLSLGRSALVGDKMTDIEAGAAAEVGLLIRLDLKAAEPSPAGPAHMVVDELGAAINLLRDWEAVQTKKDQEE